ncbi:CBS domain-containing protein [Limoniibacter endophyticus]|uniref:Inosine-5-monophosphate dehydrogenase n=1 Tax=Limoniibacter endophyticus TaxID=1565040 RepID=A0A8J3DM63_9HYPH|nr:CBS domain-containing protein [Limoniibacter endophyticus]GHC62620.1 inosine-5-monophosphate dehydrogenase [Limoniibacter endophyticus]
MSVRLILEDKGHGVFTIEGTKTLVDAVTLLAEKGVGALVVLGVDGRIVGILSERDIVRAMAKHGADVGSHSVASVMTSAVKTCKEEDTLDDLMRVMTHGRFRHLPVEKNGMLDGIVSIGDVVKWRISEVEQEAEHMKAYIASA